ncbi:MAG TPA: sigma-70 family RNA polymerase sigma factor [Thermoanaerobaculia bacterium]|nr:sigma-70 family RNA polymerase sigma factor [Thermoanaerobaculia bacterium]
MDFEAAVARHQRQVYTFAHYFLASREEAEDVTQEVLLRLWRQGDRIDGAMLGPWLMRVTRNACYDLLRRRRAGGGFLGVGSSHRPRQEDQERRASGAGVDPMENLASAEPDPEQRAQSADFARRLRQALQELPEPYRSVLIMREIEELQYQEISEALEIPLNTVRVHIHRGRQKLRDRMRQEVPHAAVG